MSWFDFMNTVLFPAGLGLLGFVEPCSMGTSLLFIKFLEGKDAAHKIAQVAVFAVTRTLLMSALGLSAAIIGSVFQFFQKGLWIAFGIGYAVIGGIYIAGKSRPLAAELGLRLSRISGISGSALLGLAFAFNIPACAGPLIFALLGMAASGGALISGLVSLSIFGLSLSLPLVVAVSFAPARRALDRLSGLSVRLPFWTGVVMIFLGLWSVWFGLFVTPGKLH